MSLYGMMRTSASGMAAQASRLGTVADNIANMSTTGYKRASTEFSTMVLESGAGSYVPGSVESHTRHAISSQGALAYTTSTTDLAARGRGFFLVSGPDGQVYMTRAGSFVMDGEGRLVNAAGYSLMGYPLANGSPSVVANGYAGLEVVNIGELALQANPSTEGTFFVNLPSNAAVVPAADLPSANAATAAFTGKSSLIAYDNLGNEVIVDIYSSKVADETWEIAVFDRAAAAAGGAFPYAAGPLATAALTFDPVTGKLDGASAKSIAVPVPDGATLTLDLSQSSQLATDYIGLDSAVNGNAPSGVEQIEISDAGDLYAVFRNGARVATHRIPLADVTSPDELQPLAGNVYAASAESGDVQIGFAGSGGYGMIVSGALEQSNVDLASELTTMIESQRNYTANSKVFQTGADLMDVLVNLKR
ncbi:MAG: flagellar hook protein FlgE [Hyphomicrobiaceae bacterium]|nr:flagellar hook protein FlgE [Hyphomicrobiaceae bacterium]